MADKLHLFGGKVQVEKIKQAEVEGGIQLVQNGDDRPASAKVINIGDEVTKVKVGDLIVVDPMMITYYTLPTGVEIILIDEKYIIGKLVPDILGV